MEQGVGTNEIEQLLCEDYTDDEIKTDREAVSWDDANEEVERIENEKKEAHLTMVKEQERMRLEQEFQKKQEVEKEREAALLKQLAEREEALKLEREKAEAELKRQEEEARQRLELQLQAKDRMLADTLEEQEAVRQ